MRTFVAPLTALNNECQAFARKHGDGDAVSKSKLYVEKVQEGSVVLYLKGLASSTVLPSM